MKMSLFYKVFEEEALTLENNSTTSTLSSTFGSIFSVDGFIFKESIEKGPITKHCHSLKHRVFRASAQNFSF
jgi:hypothetical protein